jgi:drug/metabolite transporter (DMT)-like permease
MMVSAGPLAILAANICYTGSFSVAKFVSLDTAVPVIMLFRFLAGPVYLLPYILIKRSSVKIHSWPLLGMRIVCGVSAMSLLFFAFKWGPMGTSILIFELSVLWTLLYDVIANKKMPSVASCMAIPIVFLGMGLVVKPPMPLTLSLPEGLALLGSFFNAGVYISLKKLRDYHDTVTIVFWTYTLSVAILLFPSVAHLMHLNITTIFLLVAMCSIGFLGQMAMTLGFKFASAGISSLLMLCVIPLTTLSGIIIFNESYTWVTLVGVGMVLISLTVISVRR